MMPALEELKKFAYSESIMNLEFFDYLALAVIGVSDQAKVEIMSNLWDEAGQGSVEKFHTVLFQNFLNDLGVTYDRKQILESMSWEGVAGINLFNYFSIYPFNKTKYFGMLAATEMLDNCPFHAEVRLRRDGEPVLMEIAARLAGDKIDDLLCLSRDINYFDYVYAAYLGIELPLEEMKNNYAGIRFFYRPHVDRYTTVTGVDTVKLQAIEDIAIYYKANKAIPEFPKPLRRLGHVIVKSDDYNKLSQMLHDIDSEIHFN